MHHKPRVVSYSSLQFFEGRHRFCPLGHSRHTEAVGDFVGGLLRGSPPLNRSSQRKEVFASYAYLIPLGERALLRLLLGYFLFVNVRR
jgi:hypothetical protein